MGITYTEDGIDPTDYPTGAAFKSAVYREQGAGTWLDDLILTIVWRRANGVELDDYMEKVVT